MPDKEKRKTRKQKLLETPPHPSTRGDRELSRVARMCAGAPQFLDEIAELRYNGQWFMNRQDQEVDLSMRRLQQKRNSAPFSWGESSIFSEGKVSSIEDRKKKVDTVEEENTEHTEQGATAASTVQESSHSVKD